MKYILSVILSPTFDIIIIETNKSSMKYPVECLEYVYK